MNAGKALVWLNNLAGFQRNRYGLSGINELLNQLDRPDKHFKIIHIAGTNGKGSVARLCSEALTESGLKTGLFISPHILCFEERIQLDGKFIQSAELCELIEFVKPIVEALATKQIFCSQFDVLTAIALEHFKRCGCEFVVLETGMGGQKDSTNAVLASSVEIAIITKIGLDHVKELGGTLEEIAFEKSGIVKPGAVCVCSRFEPVAALQVLEKMCTNKRVKLIQSCCAKNIVCEVGSNSFYAFGQRFETRLSGPFQIENATIALTALHCLGVDFEVIKKAFKKASWPARFEFFHTNPAVVLDGAHNFDGVCALSKALELCELEPKVGVFSVLETKDYASILEQVKKIGFLKLILTQMDNYQAVKVSTLLETAKRFELNVVVQPDWPSALELAKKAVGARGLVVVFGSLYFAAQVRPKLLSS